MDVLDSGVAVGPENERSERGEASKATVGPEAFWSHHHSPEHLTDSPAPTINYLGKKERHRDAKKSDSVPLQADFGL